MPHGGLAKRNSSSYFRAISAARSGLGTPLSFTLPSLASPQTVSKNASVLSAGRVCQLTRPRLRGPHLVRDAGRYDQDLALSERSVLPAHQDVEPAGEDLEAFLLAGVMVDGRPRGGSASRRRPPPPATPRRCLGPSCGRSIAGRLPGSPGHRLPRPKVFASLLHACSVAGAPSMVRSASRRIPPVWGIFTVARSRESRRSPSA